MGNYKAVIVGGGVVLCLVLALAVSPDFVSAPTGVFVERPVRVLFAGDLMLDRNVARSAAVVGAEGLFATSTVALFKSADLRVVNLEGTITTNPSVAQQDNKILRFTFTPALAKSVLQLLEVNAVSLANNHALDFGEFGYDDTRAYLELWGVEAFGQPFNESHLSTMLHAQGKTICLVGYHSLFSATRGRVVQEITAIRPNCTRVVVMAHWGEEYHATSSVQQQEAGHAFIDAGADLVIGAHPHVVQEYEIYQGKAIFYSLGNFMFDQNFSIATTQSWAVLVEFYGAKTGFTVVPLSIKEQYSAVVGEPVAEFTLP